MLLQLEDLGFAEKGAGAAVRRVRRHRPGRRAAGQHPRRAAGPVLPRRRQPRRRGRAPAARRPRRGPGRRRRGRPRRRPRRARARHPAADGGPLMGLPHFDPPLDDEIAAPFWAAIDEGRTRAAALLELRSLAVVPRRGRRRLPGRRRGDGRRSPRPAPCTRRRASSGPSCPAGRPTCPTSSPSSSSTASRACASSPTSPTTPTVGIGDRVQADFVDLGYRRHLVFVPLPDPPSGRPTPGGTSSASAAAALHQLLVGGQAEVGDARQPLLEDDDQLEPGEVGTEAAVRTGAEPEVLLELSGR